jgi:integrase
MSRAKHRLTAAQVRKAARPGLLADGAGLYLQVTLSANGAARRSWLFRYRSPGGQRREMGLGPLDAVSLAEAREAADAATKMLRAGVDPIEQRRETKTAAAVASMRAMSFEAAAAAYIASQSAGWSGAKQAQGWSSSLKRHAYPVVGPLPVAAIDAAMVLRVLEPIWSVTPVIAQRVRQRIEAVLDYAAVRGLRQGDNPARWRGHLQKALPAPSSVRAVRHHPALPFGEMANFMTGLRTAKGLSARALELCILTATRTGAILRAEWSEIEFEAALWTAPAVRMKGRRDQRRDHRVPLSQQALALLHTLRAADPSGRFVFPGSIAAKPLSAMAMAMALRRMGRDDISVHGFRSTFRDWVADATDYPREVAEAAMAHRIKDKTEAAYRRGDALEKRRRLMQAWADYCDGAEGAKIIDLRRKN